MTFLEKLSDGRLGLNLKKCERCSHNLIEMFQVPVEEDSYDSLIYKIIQDKDKSLKVKFADFKVMCPQCQDKEEGSTFLRLTEDELEELNNTPVSKILVTVR